MINYVEIAIELKIPDQEIRCILHNCQSFLKMSQIFLNISTNFLRISAKILRLRNIL